MSLVAFDLDDTLMRCGVDYSEAKTEFGEFVAAQTDVSVEEAVEILDEVDLQNVEEFGVSADRFPKSAVEAFKRIADDPTDENIERARAIGESVFKTTEEYAERGFISDAEDVLRAVQGEGFDLHLITAGESYIQQRKIDALDLDRYFDGIHVVTIDGKRDKLRELMDEHGHGPDEAHLVGNSLSSDVEAALQAGANAVYLPLHEWRNTDDVEKYLDHERVTIFDTPTDLAAACPGVFKGTARDSTVDARAES